MKNQPLTINKSTLIPIGFAVVVLVAAVSMATAYATTTAKVKENTADVQSNHRIILQIQEDINELKIQQTKILTLLKEK